MLSKSITMTAPARTFISKWVKNFKDIRNVRNITNRGKPQVSEHTEQPVKSYFPQPPLRSPKREVADLGVPCSTENPETPGHMFRSKITRMNQLRQQGYTQRSPIFQLCMDNFSSDSSFFYVRSFSNECISRIRTCKTSEHSCFKHTKPKRDSQISYTAKKVSWCAVHTNSPAGEYYFNNGTVRGSNIMKCYTHKSDWKLINFNRMEIISTMECFLTSHALLFSFGWKYFEFYGLEDILQPVAKGDHLTWPTVRLPFETFEWWSV